MDTTAVLEALPADLPAHEPFKISLALHGLQHVTPWITLSDGKGRFLASLELQLTALGDSLSGVRWETQYTEGEAPPERILLHTVWEETLEQDLTTALCWLLLLSAGLVCYLAYATCSRHDGALEKLFFDEYAPLQSYYQGGVYQNPSNPPLPYDPLRAVELLEEAGWSEVNDAGIRTKDGRELRLRLVYPNALTEPSLTLFQEDARAAGIALDLQLLTPAAAWKALQEKQYEMMSIGWGALVFPNPETSFSSRLADQTGNNNVTAFSDPRVDELLAEYDIEYDVGRRIEIIREIDGRIYAEQPYVLGWYLAPVRVLYSGKFAMPPWGIGPLSDAGDEFFYWWVDPERKSAVEAARLDSTLTLPSQPVENRFWQRWRQANEETD